MIVRLVLMALCVAAAMAVPSAQIAPAADLDAFMSRVLERRDENWKKLQQYVLEEHESFQLTGPSGAPLYGFRREYAWFPRDGRFIKSPLRADGVTIGEEERRRAEEQWLRREERRERRRARGDRAGQDTAPSDSDPAAAPQDAITEAGVRAALEPGFVSAAYFLRFKFDPGQYALAGREQRHGREVLRIEYYPTRLFEEGRTRPNKELRSEDQKVGARMNKASLVTLWIDPKEHQIVEYDFQNIDMDFLPGRSIVRIDGITAAMRMTQPFTDVWLPSTLGMRFGITMAIGSVDARYDVSYRDYRLASVTARVR